MAPGESENNNNAVQKVPIVNALLTFTAAIFRNSSHDGIVPLLTSHFDLTEVKDAKKILCAMKFNNNSKIQSLLT